MVNAITTSIRNSLTTAVFNKLGSTVTVSTVTNTTNSRGEQTGYSKTVQTSVTGVPYDETVSYLQKLFGVVETGGISMVLPYDTNIQYTDVITYNSVDYDIVNINYVPNVTECVALIVQLSKIEDSAQQNA